MWPRDRVAHFWWALFAPPSCLSAPSLFGPFSHPSLTPLSPLLSLLSLLSLLFLTRIHPHSPPGRLKAPLLGTPMAQLRAVTQRI